MLAYNFPSGFVNFLTVRVHTFFIYCLYYNVYIKNYGQKWIKTLKEKKLKVIPFWILDIVDEKCSESFLMYEN